MASLAQVEAEVEDGHGFARLEEIPAAQIPNELITSRNFPHVHLDHPLDVALKRMADSKFKVLPVVSRSDVRDLKGVVTLKDILRAYGIGAEQGHAAGPTHEQTGPPRRLLPSVIAVALALLILIGFLNY